MTRDEIINMPAGRKMDALIAELVMGLSVEHLPVRYEEGNTEDGADGWSGFVCPRCRRPQDMLDEPCAKNYSTDITAAWQVVELLSNDGYAPNLVNDDGGKWYLSFDGTQNLDPVTFVTAFTDTPELWCESAPLAICRAALLADVE